ncbi:MAG: hypothetical protein WA093_04585 [Minisyncoccales bacterium]
MNGSDLEKQVKFILEKNNWKVSPNLYYKDPITQKSREKDIIGLSVQFDTNDVLRYNVRLFIECKCLPEETEIYRNDTRIDVEGTLLNYNIPYADISEIEGVEQLHFYKYAEIFGAKDSKDHLYKAISQNLASFEAFRKNSPENGLYYLLVVYDGKLKAEGKNYDNALIKIETLDDVFNLPNNKCFIELISISQLDNLLKEIKGDIDKINTSAFFYCKMEMNRLNENRKNRNNDGYYVF